MNYRKSIQKINLSGKNKLKNIFKNKKVVITGNSGFKGSWLSLWMYHLGAKVLGISLKNSSKFPNLKIFNLNNKMLNKNIDIKNFKKVYRAIKIFKPDFIFHLAAEAIVTRAYKNPQNTWETNTMGTLNILESLKDYNKKVTVIMITSDKVYKNLETNKGYKEEDAMGNLDPYSASKASADLVCQSYYNSHLKYKKNIKLGIARAGNVIGGGDWSVNRIIPDCVKSWSKNKKVIIRSPYSTRPWQHVLDVLNGYLMFAEKLNSNKHLNGQIFNFGPNKSENKKVIDVVKSFSRKWGSAGWLVSSNFKYKENKLLQLNSNKAKLKLKWFCKLNFNRAISFTANWYKQYYFNKKIIFDYSISQIKDYQKILPKKKEI